MLKVPLRDRILGITWSHPVIQRAVPLTHVNRRMSSVLDVVERRATRIDLWWLDAAGKPVEEVTHATLHVYFRDQFEKEVGRKRSLKMALLFTPFNREERGTIWAAYHDRPRIVSTPRAARQVESVASADATGTP